MGWTTIYIEGREGFEAAVQNKLKNSKLNGTSEVNHKLLMFWLKNYSQLRDFKLSIGSRIIFKFRLRFFTDLEEYLQIEKDKIFTGFSMSENKMIHAMEMPEMHVGPKVPQSQQVDVNYCSYVPL